jgi:hypothetical protein
MDKCDPLYRGAHLAAFFCEFSRWFASVFISLISGRLESGQVLIWIPTPCLRLAGAGYDMQGQAG